MQVFDDIRDYFLGEAMRFGIRAGRETDISVVSYAVNKYEYGTINFLVGDSEGFKVVLQTARYDVFDRVRRQRMLDLAALLNADRFETVREHAVTGEEVAIGGRSYLLCRFSALKSSYKQIRQRVFSGRSLAVLNYALRFCAALDAGGEPLDAAASQYRRILGDFKRSYGDDAGLSDVFADLDAHSWDRAVPLKRTIVHNDLGPTNVHARGDEYDVLDWEYWDESFSLFNLFNVVLSYGALVNRPRLQRRTPQAYLSLIADARRGRSRAYLRAIGSCVAECGWRDLAAPDAERLFLLFLMSKAVCQFRVYGVQFEHDRFWHRVLSAYCENRDGFDSFWQEIQAAAEDS